MGENSLNKFIKTITSDYHKVILNPTTLDNTINLSRFDIGSAKISTGPTSVMESTVEMGGGTGFLSELCKT